MHPEVREELRVRFKKTVLDVAACTGVTKTCHEFGVARLNRSGFTGDLAT